MSARLLLAALVVLATCMPAEARPPLVLAGGTLVDGYGNPPIRNGVVVIDGERIVAVGPASMVEVPPGAEVVSTEGMTVLPGLWDMQVHLARLGHGDDSRWSTTYMPLAERVVMPLAARQLLDAGVTSARVVAAPAAAAVSVRDRVRDWRIPGPRLFVAGPQLGKVVKPGADAWQWVVAGAEDARGKVARLAEAGVDYLLLADLDLWTDDELAAVMLEARARNLPVHAYGERTAGILRGLAAGVDGFLGTGLGVNAGYPQEVMRAIADRSSRDGARPLAWSPAISALLNYEDLRRNPEPLDDPAFVATLPPLVAADVLSSLVRLDDVTWYDMPASRAPTLCTKLRQLELAKVNLVLGSDAGAPAHLHSRATWQEIDYWVRSCGIDPALAIRAATHDAAVAMRVEHESGTLSAGKYADVIAVRGDVLRHPALLQRVDIVIRRGQRHR